MKAVKEMVLTAKEKIIEKYITIKPLKEDELLIKTLFGAISIGAELPQYLAADTTDSQPTYPKITGYESYGVVEAIGENVTRFIPGDRVVAFYGHRTHGVVHERKAFKVPDSISPKLALLTILSCDAAKGVRKLSPPSNSRILITGAGTMGLLTLFYLKMFYHVCDVDILDPNLERHHIAKQLDATNTFKNESEVSKESYDFAFECSGRNPAFHVVQTALKNKGTCCILSDGNYGQLSLTPLFHEKELSIIASSDGWDYEKHAEWFYNTVKHNSPLTKLFQHSISFHELPRCFHELAYHNINPLKVLITYETMP